MTTVILGTTSYDLRVYGGTLQHRVTGQSLWVNSDPLAVGFIDAHYSAAMAPGGMSSFVARKSDGTFFAMVSADLADGNGIVFDSQNSIPALEYTDALADASAGWTLITSVANTTAPAPSGGSQTHFENDLNVHGQGIVELRAGVAPTDAVNVSQLTSAILAVNSAIAQGDLTNAQAITALTNVVNGLPAGITMPQVQAAIATAVTQAVADEIIDDATTRQLIIDAIMAQVSALDATIVARVAALEAVPSLEPRVAATEAANVEQAADIAALEAENALQQAAIGSLQAGLAQNVATDNAQNIRLAQSEARDAAFLQATTPVEVKIVNGSVNQAIGVAQSDVSIDQSSATHMTITIALGSSNAGKRRVMQALRLMSNGVEREIKDSGSRSGENYIFTFKKVCDGSNSVNLILN